MDSFKIMYCILFWCTLWKSLPLVASSNFNFDFIWNRTFCAFTECCNAKYVPFDITKLETMLQYSVFGQPFVDELVTILGAHKEAINSEDNLSSKALVLSMHGWPGVGKNYVVSIIAEALFKEGMASQYVKLINGERDFKGPEDKAKEKLIAEIESIVKKCETSLIIFDEMDKMPPGILDAIRSTLDYYFKVGGVVYRKAIFIFISNMAGSSIANKLLELYDQGISRSELTFNQFESLIRHTAYNEGGFKGSAVVANHLIDHYIPFLPLEQHHVDQCARKEFRSRKITPTQDMIELATSVVTYGPDSRPIFANNGCKRIHKQVLYVIRKTGNEL